MSKKVIDDDFISRMETLSLNLKTQMRGYFGGNHKAPTYGSTVEFADFREYTPGDDIRRIDWNMYSRFDKYFIRLFVDERQMHNQILLDTSASMDDGNDKALYAMKIAAALGYLSVQSMDRISIKLINEDRLIPVGTTVSGKESFYETMSLFDETEFRGEADLCAAIKGSPEMGRDDGLTIIISDLFTESDWKMAIDYLLYNKREVLLVQVMTPQEADPEYYGRIQLLDAEAVGMEDSRNLKMRITKGSYNAYMEALADYLEDIRAFCVSRNVTYIRLNTANPIEEELLHKLYETEVV